MAKLKIPADAAKALTVPERLLLLCVASAIDFKHAKIAEKVVTEVVVSLIDGCAADHYQLSLLLMAELVSIADAEVGDRGICNGPHAEIKSRPDR